MSGTSLDGIDVAIVDIAGKKIKTIAHSTMAYSTATRTRILATIERHSLTVAVHKRKLGSATAGERHSGDLGTATVREWHGAAAISRLNFELGELYAKAVAATCKRFQIPLESIDLIGCHGQTIYHDGGANTLQIGEASVIAERLGIPVVSDFRTRDIAAGGQGAPLVPFVDLLLFAGKKRNRVALNIGGIANVTVLSRGTAFDTGPGNMVIDQLVSPKRFDRDGAIAARGHVNRPLLDSLLRDRYYRLPPPKTAGREQYGAAFVERLLASGLPLEDLVATATALTAATIAVGVTRFAPGAEEVIAAGGGTHNRQLMAQIAAFLPECRVTTTAEFGIDPDAKEAIAFAVLAYRTWKHRTGNLPSATGARRAVVLGKVTFR
jgi:anhydro-N-acetylmuramic acid kinase